MRRDDDKTDSFSRVETSARADALDKHGLLALRRSSLDHVPEPQFLRPEESLRLVEQQTFKTRDAWVDSHSHFQTVNAVERSSGDRVLLQDGELRFSGELLVNNDGLKTNGSRSWPSLTKGHTDSVGDDGCWRH